MHKRRRCLRTVNRQTPRLLRRPPVLIRRINPRRRRSISRLRLLPALIRKDSIPKGNIHKISIRRVPIRRDNTSKVRRRLPDSLRPPSCFLLEPGSRCG
jgi:hypothetical protein